ncbi:ABC transporter permease [Peterkaempfera bronchialis]|uniref:ABC transporter permease n=1 Tax=Peterkaempfera bronchialis TaxID=2126346 RepID=UPI0013B3838C|nr:ABC transporter permease [Peterkaempfera bronchialis]
MTQTLASPGEAPPTAPRQRAGAGLGAAARRLFIQWGILPVLLLALIATFASIEPRFLSEANLTNVARQLSFLGIIALGQMLYLVTRHYDLSNGACVALSSIVGAMVMTSVAKSGSTGTAILLGCLAGIAVGLVVGVVNAVLIAVFKISAFMVTLGTASAATGTALLLSGGTPVVGLPPEFARQFGTSMVLGIPFPTFVMILALLAAYVFLNWTRLGRQAYAVGGNESAAYQSGVNVRRTLLTVMIVGSLLAALVGLMLTARMSTGEANVGVQYPLQSIIAAVLGGVSLDGGEGRVAGVLMGALFLVLLSNGMDLIRVQSYVQDILLGALLVTALLVDRLRKRMRLT